jgi:SAM-dependent methyltransferase
MRALDAWHKPVLYEWWFARTPPGRAARAVEQAAILRLLGQVARPGHAVLEYGPGTGAYTVEVARRVSRMRALEPSRPMADYLRGRLAREGITNVVVEPGALPHRLGHERGADGAVAVGVLDYLPDLTTSLGALASVLRPGGWLLATSPARTRAGRLAALKGKGAGRRVFTWPQSALLSAAADSGLRIESVTSVGVVSASRTLVWLARRAQAQGSRAHLYDVASA